MILPPITAALHCPPASNWPRWCAESRFQIN